MKKLFFVIFPVLFVFPQIVFAYSPTTTHAGLTEQIVEFYNLTHVNDLSDFEKELIISGAVLEDTPSVRALNHFYDPIRNIGINGGFTSKEWALDESIGINEYSWQKSIDSYAMGDEEKAFIALGHTLHLIEDASVPDHTRNDPHMGENTPTNSSPFEDWTHLTKTRDTLRGLARRFFDDNEIVLKKSILGEYFDFVARYSNGNFFSRDTISNTVYQYDNPKIVDYGAGYVYWDDKLTNKREKLVIYEYNVSTKKNVYSMRTDNNASVLSSYFDRLSKQAVLAGAGVIELFFREADVARADYLEKERLEQEEEERRVAALAEELSSKGIFGLIWRGVGFLVMDNVVSPVVKIAKAGGGVVKGLGRAGYAGARNIKNVIVMGGFSVNTAGAIGFNTAKDKVADVNRDVRDKVSTVKTFVQNVLNREVVNGGGNVALVLGSLSTQNNTDQQLSQDEINKLFEILANASNDLAKIENEVAVLSEINNDIPIVIVTQSEDDTQLPENAKNLANSKEKTPKYIISTYSAGFGGGGGGGGGTPTQKSYTNSTNQTQEQQETQEIANTSEENDTSDESDSSDSSSSRSDDSDSNESGTSDDNNANGDDEVTILPILEPIIITPSDFSFSFATTTIAFSGTSVASSTVEAVYLLSSATTTATTTTIVNDWSMDLFFDIGTTTISFISVSDTGVRSSSTEITLNVTLLDEVASQELSLPDSPVILSPTGGTIFTSTTILFSGTASSTDIVSTDFSLATTTTEVDGTWVLTLADFTQGTTTISFIVTDTSGATSTATSTDIFVDSIAPDMGNVVVDECAYTVSEDKEVCLIPILTLNASWSLFSGSSDFDYYELDLNGTISTTTATSTQITILPEDITNVRNNLNYSISVTAIDKIGNRSGMSGERIEIAPSPVVINEVAWAGTGGSSFDEWIELVNTTPHSISLAGMTLASGDGSPLIEFGDEDIILGDGYYLIERKNGSDNDEATESAIVDVVADTWTSFGSGLKNRGEVLTLSYLPSDSSVSVSIIFDTTPLVNDCGGWCGGEASPLYISMERIDPYISGMDKTNWKYNNTITRNGLDIDGKVINGTPRAENSPVGEVDDGEGSGDSAGGDEDEEEPFFGADIFISF